MKSIDLSQPLQDSKLHAFSLGLKTLSKGIKGKISARSWANRLKGLGIIQPRFVGACENEIQKAIEKGFLETDFLEKPKRNFAYFLRI